MMTKEGFNLDVTNSELASSRGRLTIVASEAVIGSLQAQLVRGTSHGFEFCELDPAQPIPADVIDKADAIVVEVVPQDPQSTRRIAQVHARRPDLAQIVAMADASVSTVRQLLREGVSDVLSLPLQLEELLDSAANIFSSKRPTPAAEIELAPLVAVLRAQGGEGATTLVTHLAQQFAEQDSLGKGVCIIDLDVQSGSIAPFLGLTPRRSIEDLLMSGARLDRAILKSVAIDRGNGVNLIAAPFEIEPFEQIDISQVLKIIQLARREFDVVLLDLPANWTNWNLSVLLEASQVLLVVSLQVASLRQAKRRIELFKSAGIGPDKIGIVVNRVQKRLFSNIDLKDVAETLRSEVLTSLADEGSRITDAQDQGLLLPELHSKSKYGGGIEKLALNLLQRFGKVPKS
ncbi:AAA family ATPase [Aurantiacibacter gilvus]|uniref:AAA family ATPase n=1 Tax=Aurantiacibacter gilvus TaxID=3139141 RepID=A0ABU9IF12_9SPHN